MNTAALLSLIGDLYAQVTQLQQENARLAAERDDLPNRADHAPQD